MVRILRKVINILIVVALSLFFLLLVLQVTPVQNYIAKKVVVKLRNDLNIPLKIDRIQVLFFNTIRIKGVELQSIQNDTILYASELRTSVRLRDLLKKRLYVKRLKLEGANFYLAKNKDSTLNLTSVIESIPKKEKKPKKDKKLFEIFLNRLILDNIKFQFDDEINQNKIKLALGKLRVNLENLDIQNNKIDLQSVNTEDVEFFTSTAKPNLETKEPGPINFDVNVNQGIKTRNVALNIDNKFTKQNVKIQYDRLDVSPQNINLKKRNIAVEDIDLKEALVNINKEILSKKDSLAIEQMKAQKTSSPFLWVVTTNNLEINKSNFVLSDANKSASSKLFKDGKLNLEDLNAELENIHIAYQNYSAKITDFDADFNNDLEIKKLVAEAGMDSSSVTVKDVLLETDNSEIELNGKLKLDDTNEPFSNPTVEVTLSAKTNHEDLTYFLPSISAIQQYPNVNLELESEGKFTDLNIRSLRIKAEKAIEMDLTGNIKNLTKINSVEGNLNIKKLIVRKQETEKFISDTLIPEGVIIPDTLQLIGNIRGNRSKLKSELAFISTLGTIDAVIDFEDDTIANAENFVASLNIKDLNAGKLLDKPDTLGLVSLQGDIESNSTDFKDAELIFDVDVSQFELLNYNYQNIKLKGNYKEKFFNGQSTINDNNVALVFDGKINISDSIPEFNVNLKIDSVNLGNIHLATEKTQIAGHLYADVTGKEWNQLKGQVNIENARYTAEGGKYNLKDLNVDFNQYEDSSSYNLGISNLSSNDSTIIDIGSVDAQLQGKQGRLSYNMYLTDTTTSSTNQWVKGDGEFVFTQDTIMFKTDARINHHKSQPPLDFAIDFTRFQLSEGHQNIKLIVNGTNSHLDANAALQKTGEKTEVDATVQIDSFNLGLAEPFLVSQFSTFSGVVDGKVTVKGTTDKPNISGEININNTIVNPKIINTPMQINDEHLVFKEDRLTFNDFELTDNQENSARINGYVDVAERDNIAFNLTLLATEFQLLNKPATAGGDFYGDVTADVNADIIGTITSPAISLTAAFKYDSEFYFVAPESSSGAEKQQGVIVFVNNSEQPGQDSVVPENSEPDNEKISSPTSIDISTNLEITDKLKATIITDPYSDENLEIRGNGNLSFNLTEGGDPRLVGTYSISSGIYRLKLYEVLRREFEIEPDSKLSWSGDVLDATADISASYSVNASSVGFQNVMEGSGDGSSGGGYAQIPVDVVMNLTGKLLSPNIDFDIELGESYNDAGMQAFVLNLNENESELNKQVFSLLLFNSFLTEGVGNKNPLAYELSNTAQKSLSSLLSASLNRFASQYITGANVSFDIKSYNKQQDALSPVTDFGLDFRKNLFNNRLSVQIGGNLVVDEDELKNETDLGNNLAGEFLLEYKIKKDGSVLLQGYNKTEYEDIVDGELKKTGVALIFNKEFDSFWELFNRKNKKGKNEK